MAPEVNSSAPREYHYSSYDDVHGENVEQSTIDKQDTKAKSVFDQKAEYLKKQWLEDGTEKSRSLDKVKQTSIATKAVEIFKNFADKISINYSTESNDTALAGSRNFENAVSDACESTQQEVIQVVSEAYEQAKTEIEEEKQNNEQKITVSNDRNKHGSINGNVETIKDDNGNVTSLTVTSDNSGNRFTYKKEGDKFYQVDSDGNHIKDSSGNEKVYTLDDKNNLVRDNSNISTATRGPKPAKSSTRDSYNGIIEDENGNIEQKVKVKHNKNGTSMYSSTYVSGDKKGKLTRTAVGNDNVVLQDVNQAAKTAGLKPSSKYKGYYTDGNKVYRWDKGSHKFVMVKQASIPVQDTSYKPKNDTFYTLYFTGDGRMITRNKKGQMTSEWTSGYNDYGSVIVKRYFNGAYKNITTREASDRDGNTITNPNKAAKAAFLKPAENGKYTDGKSFYAWDSQNNRFVKIKH